MRIRSAGNLVNFYVIWIWRKKLSFHTHHKLKILSTLYSFFIATKEIRWNPTGAWMVMCCSLFIASNGHRELLPAAEWGPLATWFLIPLVLFLSLSSKFLCPAVCFAISLKPRDSKGWIFMSSTQPRSASAVSHTKPLAWLHSTTANSLARNWYS